MMICITIIAIALAGYFARRAKLMEKRKIRASLKSAETEIALQQITSLADQVAALEDYEALEAWETELRKIQHQMREYVRFWTVNETTNKEV
jgi:hypothetical protein